MVSLVPSRGTLYFEKTNRAQLAASSATWVGAGSQAGESSAASGKWEVLPLESLMVALLYTRDRTMIVTQVDSYANCA